MTTVPAGYVPMGMMPPGYATGYQPVTVMPGYAPPGYAAGYPQMMPQVSAPFPGPPHPGRPPSLKAQQRIR